MTTENHRRVLVLGKSQLVVDDVLQGLRNLGYQADGTNDFSDVLRRYDARAIDLVVFGGQVPPDREAELQAEIGTINPAVIFVDGLAGIPA